LRVSRWVHVIDPYLLSEEFPEVPRTLRDLE
jgi:hypothetical protein